MPTAPTPITPYSTPPSSTDPANFDARADAKVAQDAVFVGEANALGTNVFNNATEALSAAEDALEQRELAETAALAAAGSANAAALSAGAAVWVSGSYSAGQAARSPTSMRVYIARTTGSKPTDPALDPTNWKIASAGGLPDVVYAGTTASVFLGERSRMTNVAAVAVTVPLPTAVGEVWSGLWDNGLLTNSFDIGAATLKHNGVTLTGVITNNQRLPINLVAVGVNEWRLA